jgi:hypothetical protein
LEETGGVGFAVLSSFLAGREEVVELDAGSEVGVMPLSGAPEGRWSSKEQRGRSAHRTRGKTEGSEREFVLPKADQKGENCTPERIRGHDVENLTLLEALQAVP